MTDTIRARISLFEQIQALPYRLSRGGTGACNCITKALRLGDEFSRLGLKCRQRLVEFRWSSLGIPVAVLKIPHDDAVLHQFVEVLIPESGAWVTADPTWDPGLHGLFHIPCWDGFTPTPCAVPINRTLSDIEITERFTRLGSPVLRKLWFDRNDEFIEAVDCWLQSMRES